MSSARDTAANRAVGAALAAGGPAPLGVQHGLAFGADGSAALVAEPVYRGERRLRRNYRAEQLVGMLAERGPLPAEVLHKVIRQGWRHLSRELGCSKLEAFKLWAGLLDSLLPYTASRLAQLDVRGDAAGAFAMGGAAAHFLAASAMVRLAPLPNGEIGNNPPGGPETIDSGPLFAGAELGQDQRQRAALDLLSTPARE
jgi:hypothetical protein